MDDCPIFLKKGKNSPQGMSLIELLVVMVILSILAGVTVFNFQSSQKKAQDEQRKANLRQIASALEAYRKDHGGYPASGTEVNLGKIMACSTLDNCSTVAACNWEGVSQREFCDINNTVYMKELLSDPTHNPDFCYLSSGGKFQIYAKLENEKDPEKAGPYRCGQRNDYNFGLSSGNTSL